MRRFLLVVDSVINLLLGFLLLFFPPGIVRFLGVPPAETAFYPSILGAVLVGIGIALLLDLPAAENKEHGLGLRGAVAINLCGGLVLIAWLFFGDLGLPLRGQLILWSLGAAVTGLSAVEFFAQRHAGRHSHRQRHQTIPGIDE
jgi:hypothetical protein